MLKPLCLLGQRRFLVFKNGKNDDFQEGKIDANVREEKVKAYFMVVCEIQILREGEMLCY